jgi:hypothetical protein
MIVLGITKKTKMNVRGVKLSKNAKLPLRKSTKISIGIIITVIVGDIILTYLYHYSDLDEFWLVFLMNQVLFTIAITNYLALYLVPYTYRENEFYFRHTKKAVIIMGKAFNELEKRQIDDETIAKKIVNLFEYLDQNEKEINAFTKCIIDPIKDRIQDMSEEERLAMYRNIGAGVNYYLDDLESLAEMEDTEVVELLKRRKRKPLRNRNGTQNHKSQES